MASVSDVSELILEVQDLSEGTALARFTSVIHSHFTPALL
jgi:hypothetical protein